jgi:hypothetical protein
MYETNPVEGRLYYRVVFSPLVAFHAGHSLSKYVKYLGLDLELFCLHNVRNFKLTPSISFWYMRLFKVAIFIASASANQNTGVALQKCTVLKQVLSNFRYTSNEC